MNKFIRDKIDEYIYLIKNSGIVQDYNIIDEFRNQLYSLKVEKIYNAPGDAVIDGNTLKICYENIERKMNLKGEYYLDEVLFHEFSHIINSFHKSIYGKDKFIVRDYIEERMSCFTTIELLEQNDRFLYNQDPCFGILLLDEFIAQNISQKLVLSKYKSLNSNLKNKYVFDNNFFEYNDRCYYTNICKPPMLIRTSLADYPEFDIFAQKIINKYGFSVNMFINKSLQKNFLKGFINSLDIDKIEKLYVDLCYLGMIQQRVYFLKGFIKINDVKDPAYNPQKVYTVMNKILKNKDTV